MKIIRGIFARVRRYCYWCCLCTTILLLVLPVYDDTVIGAACVRQYCYWCRRKT